MSKQTAAIFGYVIVVLFALQCAGGTMLYPLFEAMATFALLLPMCLTFDLLIFWWMLGLSAGKILDAFGNAYIGFQLPEFTCIVTVTLSVIYFWTKRNYVKRRTDSAKR